MSGSLFGIMASSAKISKTFVVTAGGTSAMTPGELLERLTLSWTSKNSITLLAPGHVDQSFPV